MRKFQTGKEFRPENKSRKSTRLMFDSGGANHNHQHHLGICTSALLWSWPWYDPCSDQRTLARNLLSETCMVRSKKISYAAKQGCCQLHNHSGEHSRAVVSQWHTKWQPQQHIPVPRLQTTTQDYNQVRFFSLSYQLSCPDLPKDPSCRKGLFFKSLFFIKTRVFF